MRCGLLRVSECAALRWSDILVNPDESGTAVIRRTQKRYACAPRSGPSHRRRDVEDPRAQIHAHSSNLASEAVPMKRGGPSHQGASLDAVFAVVCSNSSLCARHVFCAWPHGAG